MKTRYSNLKRLLSAVLTASLLFVSTEVTAIAEQNQDTDIVAEETAEEIVKETIKDTGNDSERTVTYDTTFNIIVEAISYTDDTFTTQGDATSGKSVPKMYQTDLQTLTYTGTDKAYFDLELDIQDIFDQLDLHTEGGSYVLGTPTAVSPDDYSYYGKINNDACYYAYITDVGDVSLNNSKLSMTNVRGLDKYSYYGLNSDSVYNGAYTYANFVRQVVIQIPYCVTQQNYDTNFTGTFDCGYIPTTIKGFTCGYSSSDMFSVYYAVPCINIRECNTKVPFLYVTHTGFPKSLTSKLYDLDCYYTEWNGKITDLRTGQVTTDVTSEELKSFDTNPYPYIELTSHTDATNWQILSALEKSVNSSIIDYCISETESSDLVNDTQYQTYTKRIKIGLPGVYSTSMVYNPTGYDVSTKYSDTFGSVKNIAYMTNAITSNHTIKYYNIYDDSVAPVSDLKDNAVLVDTFTANDYKAKNDNAPSTEVEGYVYLNAKSNTEQDYYDKWNRTESVYRYFAKTHDVNIDYKLKFRAVYSDGTPAEGVTLNNESTDENGFISGVVDLGSINITDCYYDSDADTYTASRSNFSNTTSYKNYYIYLDTTKWGSIFANTPTKLTYDNISSSLLKNFDSMFTISASNTKGTVTFENDEDDPYTKIAVVDIGVKECTFHVYDKYLDENGNTIEKVLRQTDTLAVGDNYTYEALSPKGYKTVGDATISGIASEDTDIVFTYQKNTYTITVIDEYYANDTLEKSETRLIDKVAYGDSYIYEALNPEGYTVKSDKSSQGVVGDADITITFKYEKIAKEHTVTIYDSYYDKAGNLESTQTRFTEKLAEGTSYTYNALSVEGYAAVDNTTYSGIITGDLTLEFKYVKQEADLPYDDSERIDLNTINVQISAIKAKVYDRNEYEPAVKVTVTQTVNGKKKKLTLTEGGDYSVSYSDNVNAGNGKVVITGKGEYKGVVYKDFTITQKSVKKLKITAGSINSEILSIKPGSDAVLEQLPIYVYDGTVCLKYGTDYEITDYTIAKNGKTAQVTIEGLGNYKAASKVKIKIYESGVSIINPENVTLLQTSLVYSGKAITPQIEVRVDGNLLTEKTDYKVKYLNNKEAGTAYVTVTGKGAYAGVAVIPFEIKAYGENEFIMGDIKDVTYNGKLQKPSVAVSIKRDGKVKKLTKYKDYTISYADNFHAGTATVTITGKGNYAGLSAAKTFTIKPMEIKKVSVKGTKDHLTLTYAKRTLKEGADYTTEYGEEIKNKVTVIITGKGDFTGEVTKKVKK